MTTEDIMVKLDPDVAERASHHIALAQVEGIDLFLTQGYRTFAQQAVIYAEGRTANGAPCTHAGVTRPLGACPEHPRGLTVTNARPGWSWHNWNVGCGAYDVAIRDFPGDTTPNDVYDGPWSRVAALGEQAGMIAGARWKHPDLPHFEYHGSESLQGLLAAHPEGL
jgi:hypothetical protein